MLTEADLNWQHPWIRISVIIRTMLHTRWDSKTWPEVKAELKKTLGLRGLIGRAGWFN